MTDLKVMELHQDIRFKFRDIIKCLWKPRMMLFRVEFKQEKEALTIYRLSAHLVNKMPIIGNEDE